MLKMILSGSQGSGKTLMIDHIVTSLIGGWQFALLMSNADLSLRPEALNKMLEINPKVRAIVFDGVITNTAEMVQAVALVNTLFGPRYDNFTVIISEQGGALMITDGENGYV